MPVSKQLIDTHAHLEDVEDLDEALRKAGEAGVAAVVTMGSDYESNLWALTESVKHQREQLRIHPAIGVHPWRLDAEGIEVDVSFVEENISEAVAIGEIGLDYWYREARKNEEKKELQKELFRRLLGTAKKHSKPVSIHSRGAWADCVDIAAEMEVEKAVFHWFTGPPDALKKLLDHGYYVSATPAAAYSKYLKATVADTPLERLLLETDSPVAYRGETSEPAHLHKALSAVAELKGLKEETVAEKTTENARLVFGI